MFNEIMEAKRVNDYLLDETEIAMKKLKRIMGWRIFTFFSKGRFISIITKNKIREVDHHLSHIKFGLRSLQFILDDMERCLEFRQEFELNYSVSVWMDNSYKDSAVEKEMEALFVELEQLKKSLTELNEKLNLKEQNCSVG